MPTYSYRRCSTPDAFRVLLDARTFTNGADKNLVSNLYRTTIEEALSQVHELRFVSQGWVDADMQALVKVLPLCTELRRLALDRNNKLTAKGAKILANALLSGAAPRLTHLGHNASDGFMKSKALRKACLDRHVKLQRYAGIQLQLSPSSLSQSTTSLVHESLQRSWKSSATLTSVGKLDSTTLQRFWKPGATPGAC